MRAQIEDRLKQLRVEFEEGQKMLAELEAQEVSLRSTLLRMSGAMQVLAELLDAPTTLASEMLPLPDTIPVSSAA